MVFRFVLTSVIILQACFGLWAKTDKYRCTWRDDPATTMVIGWNQLTGNNPIVYYDEVKRGTNHLMYANKQAPDQIIAAKDMRNHFARLTGLKPNTRYYFVIKDSDGLSRQLSFKTMSDNPSDRISIIAGGDSRNHREARRKANSLVAKLRPHFVLFAGDMTGGDNGKQWQQWFNDWQLTITKDGEITPIVVARGNHEMSNKSLIDLFDVHAPTLYYGLSFGGDLLRVYTLNSLIPAGGEQQAWLQKDLREHPSKIWKIAQYHHSIRPHTTDKSEKLELQKNWSTLFHKYQVNVAVESDAHVVKVTHPIRPSNEPGNDEGFIRDDARGTVYVGEGCWGAPLRRCNDPKEWTRSSGSFNQFKWIFVGDDKIEIRTVKTDYADQSKAVPKYDRFEIPVGLSIWNPLEGDVVTIHRKYLAVKEKDKPTTSNATASSNTGSKKPAAAALQKLYVKGNAVKVKYELTQIGDITMNLLNKRMQRVRHSDQAHATIGEFLKDFDMTGLPSGNYRLILKQKDEVIGAYEVIKR